ncbi:MAG: BsuBI/PstI family type II restriction endonuclease [Thermoanaerobaculia bacterium]
MTKLPPLPDRPEIRTRLESIFPEGVVNRNYVTREMAASTVFVMLYLGAVEGTDYYVKPDQVTRMDDEQAAKTGIDERLAWRRESVKVGGTGGWYAKNTREPIRDETLRQGFVRYGAAVERQDLPTTSPKGRYALSADFAGLFDPRLSGKKLDQAIDRWRENNLSASAQARLRLLQHAAVETDQGVVVTFPNGETRRMKPGPSSVITKAVAEEFTGRFLEHPGILWVSESGQHETYRDTKLLTDLRITLQRDRLLPDMILVDLREPPAGPLFIFVEVVSSDGPITEERRLALSELITQAGYDPGQAAFVTAYLDRAHPAFRKTMSSLAWNSFAWFLSEPDHVIGLHELHESRFLADLL